MKSTLQIVISAAMALAVLGLPAIADQPHMTKAIDLLQEAKASKEPIPLLKKAREQVHQATANKGGRRGDAMEAIDDAIELVKKGESPEGKINHAIAMIHSGKDRAR